MCTRGSAGVGGGHDSGVGVVVGFLVDAARNDLSKWTTVNVLRQWAAEGMAKSEMQRGVELAHERVPRRKHPLLAEYGEAIEMFIEDGQGPAPA
jgi:hypothetical protein